MRVFVSVFDADVRELLASRLHELGHEPVCPPDLQAAVKALQTERCPLLLVG